jgi:hypothetical protein
MNCKPGDLAVIVCTHPGEAATKQFLGRVVRLLEPTLYDAGVGWSFEKQPLRGRYRGRSVTWDNLQDEWLKPLRDPGDDAKDETLSWKPVPSTKEPKREILALPVKEM